MNKNDLSICCVYEIKTPSGLSYIGSTKNMYNRMHAHLTYIRKGKDSKLYNALRSEGIPQLQFNVIEKIDYLDNYDLRLCENKYIEILKPELNTRFSHMTEERKKELSNIRGKKFRKKNPDYYKEYYRKKKNEQ
jgi:hypothetical protein